MNIIILQGSWLGIIKIYLALSFIKQFVLIYLQKDSIICIIFHKFLIVPISMHKQCSIHYKIQEIEHTAQTHSNDNVLYYWICQLSNLARPDLIVPLNVWEFITYATCTHGVKMVCWSYVECMELSQDFLRYNWPFRAFTTRLLKWIINLVVNTLKTPTTSKKALHFEF